MLKTFKIDGTRGAKNAKLRVMCRRLVFTKTLKKFKGGVQCVKIV